MVLKRIIPVIVVTLLLTGFAVVPALALLPSGQQAPGFQLKDLSNVQHSLSDYKGKVVVIDFFGTYCGACLTSAKNDLVPLYNNYYRSDPRVQFLSIETSGVSVGETNSVFVQPAGITWPVLMGSSSLLASYGSQTTPTLYVIDTAGNVHSAMVNSIDVSTLKSTIDKLLSSGTQSTQLELSASTTTPTVGQSVTFTTTLKSGTAGLDKPVKLWCTLNGYRIDRGTFNTVNGVYEFKGPFSTKGQVIYHAEFAGDSQYAASLGTVTVNVGTTATTTP